MLALTEWNCLQRGCYSKIFPAWSLDDCVGRLHFEKKIPLAKIRHLLVQLWQNCRKYNATQKCRSFAFKAKQCLLKHCGFSAKAEGEVFLFPVWVSWFSTLFGWEAVAGHWWWNWFPVNMFFSYWLKVARPRANWSLLCNWGLR